ncbi:TorF family putative porin [Sessilibacter corallicola]|uniref:TorF family putative porin n=1 Tax=Sessilibacter corallicola TaxID=2904075 RepID=A0ABQ0A5Z0_9GAMM
MKLAKNLVASAIAVAVLGSTTAMAEVSTNIGASSNYVFRGVTQTDNGAAISGGIDYEDESGFYAGTWLSNTDFGSNEIDLYLGYGGEAGDFGYSVGYIYYAYPTTEDINYGEILLDFSYDALVFGVSYTTNGEADEPATFVEGDVHYYIGGGFDLGDDWSLGLTYGYYDFDFDGDAALEEDGLGSYGYFQVDLTKSYGDWGDITISLSDADEESGEEDPLTWISWTKGF